MEENRFTKGVVDGIPICLGYLSVAFAFGIFAVGSGLSALETLLISMTNVTSAGQLAAVPIITAGGSFIELAVAQLIINIRYSLMSVSLSQKLGKSVGMLDRFIISFVNTDEVFAVASGQKKKVGKRYLYGLILTPYIGWSIGTLLGGIAGNVLPKIVISSLGVAIYAMFVAIVVPRVKEDKATGKCVILAIILSCIFYYMPILKSIPSGFVIIICAVLASAVFAYFAPVPMEVEEDE
ncbi:MAG: AzlC family ABC transporter permease [Ruminococcaceae bacterium]|nr:AzlC family ABC transporter permease [Oscillospiraceae bacterium]